MNHFGPRADAAARDVNLTRLRCWPLFKNQKPSPKTSEIPATSPPLLPSPSPLSLSALKFVERYPTRPLQWRASIPPAPAPPTIIPTNPSRSVRALPRPPCRVKKKPRVRFDWVVFPLSVTGDSGAWGLGVQPQLQPQGEPPRCHLMGQPGEVAAVVRTQKLVYAEIYLLLVIKCCWPLWCWDMDAGSVLGGHGWWGLPSEGLHFARSTGIVIVLALFSPRSDSS